MAHEAAQPRRLQDRLLILAAAAYAASVMFSDIVSRNADGIATIWTANGVLAAALVSLSPRRAWLMVLFCLGVHITVDWLVGDPWPVIAGATALDMAESVIASLILRRVFHPHGRVRSVRQVFLLMVAVVPLTAVAGAISAGVYSSLYGAAFFDIWSAWFMADWMGLAVTAPTLLILVDRDNLTGFRRSGLEQAGLYGLIALATFVTFGPTPLQAPFLIFPAAIVAAVRLGPRGAALGALIVGAVAGPITLAGLGPTGLNGQWNATDRMHVLELFVATLFVTALALALAIAQQTRMKTLLVRRDQVARAARARALAASEAKSQFLATMSHEIRTPLNSVLGFTRLLLDRHDLAPEAQHQLEMVDRAGESLLTVVNDVLDFARVEAGKVDLQPRPTDLAGLVRDTAEIVAADAARAGLSLDVKIETPAGRLHAVDDRRLRQVLLNLLNNAIKFTPRGHVTALLAVTPGDGADRIRLEVHDSGVGIAADKLPRLFLPFSQADGSVSRAYGGAGLGLAICRALAEAMGGRIGVDSVEGRGSCFWVDLTLPVAAEAEPPAPSQPVAPSGVVRVLLVDDHPMNRELGVALLTLAGCETETAEDGAQAVAAAAARPFDLILMDIHMPRMDGLEAARAIRALPGPASRTPIIALTADALPQNVARCREAGMVDHVAKPIRREALFAAMDRCLGLGSQDPHAEVLGETPRQIA